MVRINGLSIFPENYLKEYNQKNFTSITGDRTVNKTFTEGVATVGAFFLDNCETIMTTEWATSLNWMLR